MTAYLRFAARFGAPALFCCSLTFVSSLGQTFFVSLFLPSLVDRLGLSNGTFGSMFSAATLLGALLLTRAGRLIDSASLEAYTRISAAGVLGACVLLALAFHPIGLFLALLCLRFTGQGLMTHVSLTVAARHFEKSRGKALSLAALGYSAGELFFPPFLALLFPLLGWRAAAGAAGALVFLLVLAELRLLPVKSFERVNPGDRFDGEGVPSAPAAPFEPFKDALFRRLVPSGALFTMVASGYLFYQMIIVRSKGWSPVWYAGIFVAYAAARVVFTLCAGPLVDRFGPRWLYPLHNLPVALGAAAAGLLGNEAGYFAFLLGMALTVGFSNTVQGAALAEAYGPERAGAVRSAFSAAMIIGSSLGPAGFGLLMDAGVSMDRILVAVAVLLAVASAFAVPPPRRRA